jgi:hypothetical protein
VEGVDERRVFSARILSPLHRYVTDTRGPDAAARAFAPAPRAAARSAWLSHAEFEAALAGVRAALDSDEEFLAACAHRLLDSYGPIALVLRALSIETYFRLLARTMWLVARESTYEIAVLGDRRVLLRYRSPLPESRLMCLSRVAQLGRGPTEFGLPAVTVEEQTCIARGDRTCKYLIRWDRD